jgi:hypothetical protein
MSIGQEGIDEMTSNETRTTSNEQMHIASRNRAPTAPGRGGEHPARALHTSLRHCSSILTAVFVDVMGFCR